MITLKSFHCRCNRGVWKLTYEISRSDKAEEFITGEYDSLKAAMLCLMESVNQLPIQDSEVPQCIQ